MTSLRLLPSRNAPLQQKADAHAFSYTRQAQAQQSWCRHSQECSRDSVRAVSVGVSSHRYTLGSSNLNSLGGDRLRPNARTSYDVVGLGEAMVDYSGMVSSEYLEKIGMESGGRRVISIEERAATIDELEAHNFQLNAGGSLANTLSGMAVLARAAHEADPKTVPAPRIGMAGCIGSDALGMFFQKKLQNSGVEWVGTPQPETATGTVVVLTTPDAQRSFLSFPGAGRLQMCPTVATGLACSRITLIEGYLWEMPDAEECIFRAIALARAAGSIVVMTAADVSVVKRHRSAMLRAAAASDLLFSNAEEARALAGDGVEGVECLEGAGTGKRPASEEDCLHLGQICPMVVVTRGSAGSCIAALGRLNVVPPHWAEEAPVDTCGAGDAYAAGFLHAYMRGFTVRQMGELGAECASSVLGQQGPKLEEKDAKSLVTSLQRIADGSADAMGAVL